MEDYYNPYNEMMSEVADNITREYIREENEDRMRKGE